MCSSTIVLKEDSSSINDYSTLEYLKSIEKRKKKKKKEKYKISLRKFTRLEVFNS
jgi:hypothetical protein